jgi:hypothetical protein
VGNMLKDPATHVFICGLKGMESGSIEDAFSDIANARPSIGRHSGHNCSHQDAFKWKRTECDGQQGLDVESAGFLKGCLVAGDIGNGHRSSALHSTRLGDLR